MANSVGAVYFRNQWKTWLCFEIALGERGMILRVVLQFGGDYLFIIRFLRFHLFTCEGSEVKGFLFMRGENVYRISGYGNFGHIYCSSETFLNPLAYYKVEEYF